MSHLNERKEKICLNCKTSLYGRYCHVCGQENLEPKETVWHLVMHFFNDVTHFDGKFFSTVQLLITKPGFLSKEYMLGRRASYLNPIRMYVFTSAIFFLIFFSLKFQNKIVKINESKDGHEKASVKEGVADWQEQKNSLTATLGSTHNKINEEALRDSIEELDEKMAAAKKMYGDTTTKKFSEEQLAILLVRADMDSMRSADFRGGATHKVDSSLKKYTDDDSSMNNLEGYKTVASYDSAQLQLPESKRDGWFTRMISRKFIEIKEEVRKDKQGFFEHFKENFVHSFPKILFFSLPFFALILKLVYVRRKQFYYTNHGIFSIHLYCAMFILLLGLILLNQVSDMSSWAWVKVIDAIINIAVWLYMVFYTYKAMRTFYMQGRIKTLLKYCIVAFLAMIVNLIILVIFLLISAISV